MNREALYDGQSFNNMYMTSFLQYLIDCGTDIRAAFIHNGWLEVDTFKIYGAMKPLTPTMG